MIRNYGPSGMGYPPDDDGYFRQFISERLFDWDKDQNNIPMLASSWDTDPVNNTITWHLQKGVKFQDGTDFNAQAVKWNIQRLIDLGLETGAKNIKSMDVLDDYTLRMNLVQLTTKSVINHGWAQQYSPTAYTNNGEEWAKTHQVGVGPFIFDSWERDNYANYKKDNNYWRGPGTYPYLDGINFRLIPDPVSASAMMEAGQADLWMDVPVKFAVDLEEKGFTVNWGPGFFWGLFPNSKDPNSIYTNKTVREALEYAIDRPALAKTMGYGKYEALTQLAHASSTGYNPGYDPRPYNPDKAKQLLAQAGYPNGFQTKILCTSQSQDTASAIQAYLAAVGINAKIDLADNARYYAEFMAGISPGGAGGGFSDLAIGMTGIDTDFSITIDRHWGPTPMTGIISINGAKSPQFLALCDKLLTTFDPVELKKVTQETVKQASEDALAVPLYRAAYQTVMQKNVHSDNILITYVVWNLWKDWIGK
jgi:peptide/nickel transport system substrate-binding protein